MADKIYNVLFLCTQNSARSIMAEAIMNDEGRGKFRGFSAGSEPATAPRPEAIALLHRLNYKTDDFRSKNWSEFAEAGAPEMDFVFTVCDNAAAETCPVWPGQPMTAHWGVPDPSSAEGSDADVHFAFAEAYRQLRNRISIFVNLPMVQLDRFALQKRLDDIGRTHLANEEQAPA